MTVLPVAIHSVMGSFACVWVVFHVLRVAFNNTSYRWLFICQGEFDVVVIICSNKDLISSR